MRTFSRLARNNKAHACAAAILSLSFAGHAQTGYWQQEVNYTIHVKLDDVKHELNADESIEYINNSPDALPFLYFHLWPNAYKNNKTALGRQCLENGKMNFYYAKDEDRGYIDQLDFKVDGEPVKMQYMGDSIDICKLFLNKPLQHGEHITITTPFHVKIPLGVFSRIGHIGQQYQVTQWYPKPAVYDANGWNPIPYLDQGEFYSEFGSYDVYITVPKNYVVGATGDLPEGDPETEWLNKKAEETKTKVFLTENKPGDYDAFPASDPDTKTLHYHQSKVHDFAWFCDKRYNVLKGEVELPHSKRKVNTWVMFTNGQGDLWKDAIPYVNDALYYYSLWNGDYAYNHATAVDGALSAGGGMEYPNITVIGETRDAFLLDVVITHEVGHNWFYGMLGSNERMHAWMDEGINSANENRYVKTKYPDALLVGGMNYSLVKAFDLAPYKHKSEYELGYLINAKKNEDQPIEYPAWKYTELNYAGVVYSKTAIIFDYLHAYLGDELYDKCAQEYFTEWEFKHPMPKDVREVYERVSGKNLSWFFDDLINTTKKLDYKIKGTRKVGDRDTYAWKVIVKNTGDIPGPFCVSAIDQGKVLKQVWVEGIVPGTSKEVDMGSFAEVDHFRIDPMGDMPEVNRDNNIIKTKGLFKKTEPLRLQFLGSLDNPEKTQLFYSPAFGWNNYNGFMAGLVLYNNLAPEKKFEYILMPMYGFKNKDLAGMADLRLNMHPGHVFQTVRLGVNAERFAYSTDPFPTMNFNKVAPYLELELKRKELRNPYKNIIKFREVGIVKNSFYPVYLTNIVNNIPVDSVAFHPRTDTLLVSELSYYISKTSNLHPWNSGVKLEASKYFTKLSFEANYRFNFKAKNKSFDIRIFAGTFLDNSNLQAGNYAFHMSGITGWQDYLYDDVFLGRSEGTGLLAHQFSDKNGGFKVFTPYGSSTQWIASVNLRSSIPKVPYLELFADIGTSAKDGIKNDNVMYEAGACLSIGKGLIEVFFPLLLSNDLQSYVNNYQSNYFERVRFTFNINLVNPFNLIRNFSL
ncbi:MAG TPA: M1 family metallopeptidase [Bacteroidia bacterium]